MLAFGLASLTYQQTGIWTSDGALWTNAARVAPNQPEPWLHLAWEQWRVRDATGAERHLARALALMDRQPPTEQAWVRDQVQVLMAQLLMARGQLRAAGQLMVSGELAAVAGHYSELGTLCQHNQSVCALADSAP